MDLPKNIRCQCVLCNPTLHCSDQAIPISACFYNEARTASA